MAPGEIGEEEVSYIEPLSSTGSILASIFNLQVTIYLNNAMTEKEVISLPIEMTKKRPQITPK